MTDVAKLSPETFFTPKTGIIAKVKPDFKPRKGQQELSETILAVTKEYGVHVLAEAPTGFGKSFAAVVPAIIQAVTRKKRIVISTETIALQDQYILKDLPLLQKACAAEGINFTFAVAKGRSNYLCRGKLDEAELSGGYADEARLKKWGEMQQIGVHSGDRASVPFNINDLDWRKVGADEDCERKGCPFYGEGRQGHSECFIYDAQRQFLEADIVVTNHKLFLLDAQNDGRFLAKYDMAIIDEAHTIPEQAQSTWGMEIGPRTVSKTLKLVHRMLRRVGVNHFEAGFLDHYSNLEDAVFAPFKDVVKHSMFLKHIPDRVVDESKSAAKALLENLVAENKMLKEFGEDNADTQEMIEQGREKIYKLVRGLKAIYGEAIDDEYKDNWIVFLESGWSPKGGKYVTLHLKPIDVAPLIKGLLIDVVPNIVWMSATLKIGPSFAFMRKELGMREENCIEFTGETPFDYLKSVVGYFPTDLPDPDEEDYFDCLTKRIRTIIRRRKGRTLILFTSADLMRKCHENLKDRVEYHCYVQGEASKNVLIEHFQEDIGSCLFATRSFFTGVDIPGEALSTVILTKSPFRVPSDPLFKAKCDKIKDRGGDDFVGYSMPLMLMDVRQAFGRLIRSVDDVGMFCFLDSRAMKKNYGTRIKNSLPKIRIVSQVEPAE